MTMTVDAVKRCVAPGPMFVKLRFCKDIRTICEKVEHCGDKESVIVTNGCTCSRNISSLERR